MQAAGDEHGVVHIFDTAVLRTPAGASAGALLSVCRTAAPAPRPPSTPPGMAAAAGEGGLVAPGGGLMPLSLVGWYTGPQQQLQQLLLASAAVGASVLMSHAPGGLLLAPP